MNKKLLGGLIGLILVVASVISISYPEPWGGNQDANNNNLSNADVISANTFEGTNVYATNIYGTPSWCYQEFSNVSTSCGGEGTGVYSASGTNWLNVTRLYDGNWTLSASFNSTNGSFGYFDINYTKVNNSLDSSLWQIKRAVARNNYSIDSDCWNQSSTLIFRGVVNNISEDGVSDSTVNYWQCYNGSAYINVTAAQSGSILYEEAMWWEILTDANVNWTLSWDKLKNYPTSCPGSSAVTTLNDSSVCSDLWVDVAGDTMVGDFIINGSYVIQLISNETTLVCNATNAGDIYYNNDVAAHYGCNSSNWNALY